MLLIVVKIQNKSSQLWDSSTDVIFGNNKIYIDTLKSDGLYDNLCLKAPITLKNFIGNERIMLNQHHHQDLKKIFQKNSIPVWERESFVLFYAKNELLLAYSDNNKVYIFTIKINIYLSDLIHYNLHI